MSTKYLIITARTNSEWDSAQFALIPISLPIISKICKKIRLAKRLKKQGIDYLLSYDDGIVFFQELEDLPDNLQVEEGKIKIHSFTDQEIEKFTKPEQSLDTIFLKVFAFGVLWSALGKHTSEEFWTDDISFDFLKRFEKLEQLLSEKALSRNEYKTALQLAERGDDEDITLLDSIIKSRSNLLFKVASK